jgi:hypothetical protein
MKYMYRDWRISCVYFKVSKTYVEEVEWQSDTITYVCTVCVHVLHINGGVRYCRFVIVHRVFISNVHERSQL